MTEGVFQSGKWKVVTVLFSPRPLRERVTEGRVRGKGRGEVGRGGVENCKKKERHRGYHSLSNILRTQDEAL